MTLLEKKLPDGNICIDTKSRIARFYSNTSMSHFLASAGTARKSVAETQDIPWQVAWEQDKVPFSIFFRWRGGRYSPWLASRKNPFFVLISELVGDLDEALIQYEERRKKITIVTEAGRFPFYLENGTMEWSKTRKLFYGLLDSAFKKRVRVEWKSYRGWESEWDGEVVIDGQKFPIGHKHNLNLSLNVYLCKTSFSECLNSNDPLISTLSLLDHRFKPQLAERQPIIPDCCDKCQKLFDACFEARRPLVDMNDKS